MKRTNCSCIILVALLLTCIILPTQAQDMPEGFSADDQGAIHVVDLSCKPIHYDSKWRPGKFTVDPSYTTASNITNEIWKFDSELHAKSGQTLRLMNKIQNDETNTSIHWLIDANSDEPVPTAVLALNVSIPAENYAGKTITINGKEIELPQESGKQEIYIRDGVTAVSIPTEQGTIQFTGKFKLQLTDLRRYNTNKFSMRLYFTPGPKILSAAKMDLNITIKTFDSQSLNMRSVVNMAFADEVSGDQKGGWTDQGAANDLRAMPPGKKNFSGLCFEVIDPKKNDGKSALILRGKDRPYFPNEANIPTPQGSFRTLWLLHTLAWGTNDPNIGCITVSYADGSTQQIPVRNKVDLADWWGANTRQNGSVVWSAPNGVNHVGLYLSRFKLENKTLKQITLSSEGVSVWAIVAMTVSKDAPPLPKVTQVPMTIHADDQWSPLATGSRVVPGSVMDLSFINEPGPAGQFGKIVSRDGHLEFEKRPGIPVRLFGPNLVFGSCFLPHDDAKQLANDLKMMGYNYLRLHHFDQILRDPNGKYSYDLDKEKLDQLYYFLACLKQQGIYVSTDLFTIRDFSAEESSLGKSFRSEIKPLFQVDEKARQSLEKWATQLFCQVNPYTGKSLADDQMLATVSLMNEEFLIQSWSKYPQIKAMYLQHYGSWLKTNSFDDDPTDTSSPHFTQFIYKNSTIAHNDLMLRLRMHGIAPLFTANNADRSFAAALQRDQLDYVDNHFYHDHPAFGEKSWSLPYVFSCTSALRQQGGSLRQMFPTRLWNKPFSISEYNFVLPNPYRSESGPLMGAYAGLQDWNMLCRFQWSGGDSQRTLNPQIMRTFSVNGDPINRMAERITALLFKRGDVAKAKKRIAYLVTADSVYQPGMHRGEASFSFTQLGLISGIGMLSENSIKQISNHEYAAIIGPKSVRSLVPNTITFIEADDKMRQELVDREVIEPSQWDTGHSQFISDTNQITMSAGAGKLIVDTPMSQAVILTKPGSSQTTNLKIDDCSTAATFCFSSLDDKPLRQSSRMILMHLSDALNTNMRFADQHRRILTDWGTSPLLVKKSTAQISLKVDHPQNVTVFSVDLTGKRINTITSEINNGYLTFTADTSAQPSGVLAYELTRHP